MVDNKNDPRRDSGASWQEGLRVFTDISGWIVGPVILALFAGRALDEHYGTKPWLFLALIALAFLVTIQGIYKAVKRYTNKIK
jgi:F0F1-type ATP synthase assembly protein I